MNPIAHAKYTAKPASATWAKRGYLRTAWIVLTVLLFSLLCTAQSSDEPLGNVARQNKATRKAARVITNDEIPSATIPASDSLPRTNMSDGKDKSNISSESVPVPATKATAANQSSSGITIPGVLTNGSVQDARAALETLKHDREAFISNYEKIQRRLNETDDEALRQTYADVMATRESTLAKNAKAIADTESAIRNAENAQQGGHNETK